MDSNVFTAVSKDFLPLASLRLLVPPLQLLTASMWHVLQKQAARSYWDVAEFVSLVVDMVPELLMYKHRTKLNLGLRARYILELCRSEQPVKPELILSYLDKMKSSNPVQEMESDEEVVKENFLELIRTLLKDPGKKHDFFTDVFPVEYGPRYDSDLQMLFSEFLCRLAQLLPVPDLEQTVSWLRAECALLEECVQTVSEPSELKNLLQHHRKLVHLEQHVPPASMGNNILSSLSALPSQKEAPMMEQPQSDPPQGLIDDTWTVMVEGDNVVEIVTVPGYAEVEVGATPNIEAENPFEGTEDSLNTKENRTEEEVELSASSLERITTGQNDCPDCGKSFKFASSLLAHRVIHTGERPHRCSDCGRCFSFRQSLDRHKHTHRAGRRYGCVICGETFHSSSARTRHVQTHTEDGVYTCHWCNKRFIWELTFVKHLKSHDEGGDVSTGSSGERPIVDNINEMEVEPTEPDCPVQVGDQRPCRGADQSNEPPASEPGGPAAEEDAVLPVNVRTSGRQRRPTMKVQVLRLQKHTATKQKKDVTRVSPAEQKPSHFISSEHSYGSFIVSKDGDESSPTDASAGAFSCPQSPFHNFEKVQVLQHSDKVDTVEDKSSPQPLPDEGGPFSCSDCGKLFRFPSLLKAHRRVHTGEKPFPCSQCGRQFSFKQSLERHKQTRKICGEPFTSAGGHLHDVKHGEYLCSECGRVFAWKSALVRHLQTHGSDADEAKETFKCPDCELVFSCASHLRRHLLTHSEERGHICNCGKSFAYRAALTVHQRIHQKERPHACAQCGKGFLYKAGLLSHMKIHSEEMPFMCSFCGKSFKRERNMKKHERCHTRENVFSCSQCDKSFVYKATLIRHELTHSGERPYLCSDCGKGFFSHGELLKHERFHTGHKPFQCPHCGKKFTQSCYLTIHLRYHTGVRPYSCSECDKSFLSANRLKRHQRTHSGEKPYLCGKCGKRFRQSYHLKMHQRTHT